MARKKISRLKKNIVSQEDLSDEKVKARISIMLSVEILKKYKAEAARRGIGYQTLIQIKLQEGLDNDLEKRVSEIERTLRQKAV